MDHGVLRVLCCAGLLLMATQTMAATIAFNQIKATLQTITDSEEFNQINATIQTITDSEEFTQNNIPTLTTTANEEFSQTKATTETITPDEGVQQKIPTTKVDILERIFQLATPVDYEPQEPPGEVAVNVAVAFLSVPAVKFSRTEIEVEFLFIAMWHDNRFSFDNFTAEVAAKHGFFKLADAMKSKIWVPQIYYPECKRCKNGVVTGEDPRPMMFIPASHEFLIFFRDTVVFNCQFDLTFYPFDAHECHVALEFAAFNNSLQLNDAFEDFFQIPREYFIISGLPSEFRLDSSSAKHECSRRTFSPSENPSHCLQYSIQFHRIPSYYLMLIYTPTFVIVVISWATFWLSTDAAAPRVALGLTSLLTLTTQFANAQKDLPPVAYVKALDVWMLMCVVMVFGTLVEFTLAHNKLLISPSPPPPPPPRKEPTFYAAKYSAKKVKLIMDVKKSLVREPPPPAKQVNPLDAISRIAFPGVFLVFNLIYWPYYGRGG